MNKTAMIPSIVNRIVDKYGVADVASKLGYCSAYVEQIAAGKIPSLKFVRMVEFIYAWDVADMLQHPTPVSSPEDLYRNIAINEAKKFWQGQGHDIKDFPKGQTPGQTIYKMFMSMNTKPRRSRKTK